MFRLIQRNNGFSLVEAILAGALFLLLALSIISVILYGQEGAALAGKRARAVYLAEEGIEATRNLQAESFTNLAVGTYSLGTTSNHWVLNAVGGGNDVIGIFNRQITISDLDSQRKNVSVAVNWTQNAQRNGSVALSTTLTNWRAPSIGDWTNPNTLAASLDLTGNVDGWRVKVVGNYAYVIRNNNSNNFSIVDITNPSAPSLVITTTILGNIRDLDVAGNYVYFSSSNDSSELIVYDVSNPGSPTQVGVFDAAGKADGYSVLVVGNTAYLGRVSSGDPEFYVLNITNPASISSLGSLNLTGNVNKIVIGGNYAYLASSNTAQEMQVINISNPASMSLSGFYNATGGATGNDIVISSNVVALALSNNAVAMLDITTPSSPALYSSFAAGGAVSGLSLGNNDTYLFVSSANSSAELQVLNITNPSLVTLVGSYSVASGTVNDVFYDSTGDRAYLTSSVDTTELIIIAP